MPPEDVRQRFVDAALAVVGFDADPRDPCMQQQYRDLVAPGEVPARQQEMATMSGCALVVAGIWRRVGIEHPILAAPYVDESAVSRLSVIGRGAWIPYALGKLPQLGDAVRIGDNTVKNGIEHMYIVTQIVGGHAPLLHSVDGGRRDASNFETVEDRQRAWMHGRDVVAGTSGSRGIMGWFDAVLLASLIPNLDENG